jgi:hypothetical protein
MYRGWPKARAIPLKRRRSLGNIDSPSRRLVIEETILVVGLNAWGLNYSLPLVGTKKAPEGMVTGDVTALAERSYRHRNVRRFAKSQEMLLTLTIKKDKLKVGQVINGYDAVGSLVSASKVVEI